MKKMLIGLLLLIVLLLVLKIRSFSVLPGPSSFVPTVTPTPLPPSIFSGWVPNWNSPASISSLNQNNKTIDVILPVWYRFNSQGQLVEFPHLDKATLLKQASASGIKVMPSISNETETGFDPNLITTFLNNPDLQQSLSDNLVLLAQKNNYLGWDIDWEQIKFEDKDLFSNYIKLLSQTLHQNKLELSVSVHAQSGKITDWTGTKGQDLVAIGQSADWIRIMAYEFHYASSDPGPITPLDALDEVISFNTSILPLSKIILGLPTYGYDWVSDEPAVALQFTDALKLVNRFNLTMLHDDTSKELTTVYYFQSQRHVVWFPDATSLNEKIKLARKYGIYRFCFWHLGGEGDLINQLQASQ